MISDITIGQFMPGRSFVHKIDPRMKIILMTAIIVFIFLAKNLFSMGAMVGFVALAVLFSRIPLRMYFKGLKAIWFLVFFTAALNMLYIKGEHLVFQYKVLTIYEEALWQSGFIALRLVMIVIISSMLTYTTSPTDLTAAIERLLAPLKLFRLPVHELAMMMTIALRFIPTLLEETEKIMNAQKARGADMESGNLFKRVRALIPILVPLFVSAFRRAYDIATAMECRCYRGGTGRTRMKILKLSARDIVSFVITAIVILGVILCNTFMTSMI